MKSTSTLLKLFFAIVCLSLSHLTQAEVSIVARSYYQPNKDNSGIEEVSKATFRTADAILNAGYRDSPTWVRLVLNASDSERAFIRVRPNYLDYVTLFEKDADSGVGWIERYSGDRLGPSQSERLGTSLGFLVNVTPGLNTYYLKLQTTSTSMVYAESLTLPELSIRDARQNIWMGIYVGLILCMVIWSLMDYLHRPNRLSIMFAIYHSSYLGYALAIMGYFYAFASDHHPSLISQITSVLIIATVALSCLFHCCLFRHYQPNRLLLTALGGLSLLMPIELWQIFNGQERQALQMNATVILVIAALFVALAFTAKREGLPNLKLLRTVYLIQTLSLIISMLPILGIVRAQEWNLHATLIHGLVSSLLMFFVLHRRSSEISRNAENTLLALEFANQELLHERAQRDSNSRFLAMVTHELKTPLAVIRMCLDSLKLKKIELDPAERALSEANSIIERCAQLEKIDYQEISIHYEECNLEELLKEELSFYRGDDVKIRINQPLRFIQSDRIYMKIILKNLIENAVKYAKPDTDIMITMANATAHGKPGIRVQFINLISEDQHLNIDQVFEKFYRGVGARRYSGFGLGLYLTKSLALILKGEIKAELDRRLVKFTLWIPA